MALPLEQQPPQPFAENIRLVVWDLDETFWDGTLSEGGITYRLDHHEIVMELARRGIMSSICSKNDPGSVEDVLRHQGLWDHFIFPSIDWTPKGPRLRQMIEQIGLRAASVLLIDDNPMNLAQAFHMNPGLNTATPDIIADLLDQPQLRGKDDPTLTRLAQYKVKERKAAVVRSTGDDTIAFLRRSGVRVYLEYDVEAHLDRAIELINRTNQLNFTKKRLPEDLDAARRELTAALSHNTTDAALVRVRDDFGDYGFAGFYLTRRVNNVRRLEHFCFSCRTLNMFIEHWAYDFLGRPPLAPVGDVLTDPTSREVTVDWITPAPMEDMARSGAKALRFDRIFARGGCDLASLMHYFSLHTEQLVEEFNQPKNGQMFRRDHTAFLMPGLTGGLTPEKAVAAESLGYAAADFKTCLREGPTGPTFLSFWADADIPEYQHRESGLRVPYWLVGAQQHDLIANTELSAAVARTDVQRARLETLSDAFECLGVLSEGEMRQRYAAILDAVPRGNDVIVVLANERGPVHFQHPDRAPHPTHQRLNTVLRDVAADRENVLLLDPADHIFGVEDLIDLNHFKRPVYHRMYKSVMRWLDKKAEHV